ncbi:succinate dehydrogenase [Endozoicomonas montiporae]|uniref:Succinate dehydrogenase hydrophobic membrane anchor subunit n=2 Tax=Endozoicomonas montiporae TaxID=1027273 RepID=A0A081N7D5_9GAMM|nr:succinate dehydrogenase, hydrophobic membrane anchor protein [Endozoicomonas montiporae]AMO55801.1 succinate dehydrogenase [Endozoicomonas montiporae CL-33]KEQ14358.1 succinate dehydrogenase [Endozoicomonas montiporae]
MVTNITNLSRSGLYDWMLQRLSAIILAVYTLFIVGYILTNPGLSYAQWSELFTQVWVRIFTFLALLSLVAHAWVGMWTIATDYLNSRAFGEKSVLIRFPVQLLCFIALFSYLVWGTQVIWGH